MVNDACAQYNLHTSVYDIVVYNILIHVPIYCVTQLHLQECFAKKSHRSARESAFENYSYTVVGDSSATSILMKFLARQMDSYNAYTYIDPKTYHWWDAAYRYLRALSAPKKKKKCTEYTCPYTVHSLSVNNITVITSCPALQ